MDEQEQTDNLEDACGGPDKTFRLLRILERATQARKRNHLDYYALSTVDGFRQVATREGYSKRAINLMLNYQD